MKLHKKKAKIDGKLRTKLDAILACGDETEYVRHNPILREKDKTMKTFRKLLISLNGSEPEAIIKKLETQSSQYWYHNTEKDHRIEEIAATVYCFTYSENADKPQLPPALLYIAEKQKGIFSVTNILPAEKYELSYDEYNALLVSFYDELVLPAAQQTLIHVEITPPEIKLEELIPTDVAKSLQDFSSNANKFSGFFMPLDEQHWFEFLTGTHRSKKPLPTTILEKALEEDGWDTSMAFSLAEKYESALNLLAYYDAH
ncbi:MAG: hypothetical protein ABFS56_02635 [Pseudomonadota bacterium]